MLKTIKAKYKHGIFEPIEKVRLEEGTEVNISIFVEPEGQFSLIGMISDGRLTDEDIDEVIDEWNKPESQ